MASCVRVAVGVDFLFFEMDIWMLRSPMPLMRANATIDFMLALHQDNPYTVNVGIYYVRGRPHNAFLFVRDDAVPVVQRLVGTQPISSELLPRLASRSIPGIAPCIS